MLGSPRVTKATCSPASSQGTSSRAGPEAGELGPPVPMGKTTRSTRRWGRTWRTTDSARPTASGAPEGATTRSAASRAPRAWRVTRSGWPGPTPTPVRRAGGVEDGAVMSWSWAPRQGSGVAPASWLPGRATGAPGHSGCRAGLPPACRLATRASLSLLVLRPLPPQGGEGAPGGGSHEALRRLRVRPEVQMEVGGEHGGGGPAPSARSMAPPHLQGPPGGLQLGVVELVALEDGPGRGQRGFLQGPGPPVAEGEPLTHRPVGRHHPAQRPSVQRAGQPEEASALGPGHQAAPHPGG